MAINNFNLQKSNFWFQKINNFDNGYHKFNSENSCFRFNKFGKWLSKIEF